MEIADDVASAHASTQARWHIWRGSPELLAHVIRVAERASGGVDTSIDVAVADDHEVFVTAKDFVGFVTLDALRHFSSIAISTSGPRMRISILLQWTPTDEDHDAEVTITADGVDADDEHEALAAVHRAIKRGGTDGERRRTAFLSATRGGMVVAVVVAYLVMVVVAPAYVALIPLFGPALAEIMASLASGPVSTLVMGLGGAIAVGVGLAIGKWAYPALEVAERGETRLWRVARGFGGVAVTLAVAIFLKLVVHD
jgi:hypothetical protein